MRRRFLRSASADDAPGAPGRPPRRSSRLFFLGRVFWLRASRSILPTMLSEGAGAVRSIVNISSLGTSAAGAAVGVMGVSGALGADAASALGVSGASFGVSLGVMGALGVSVVASGALGVGATSALGAGVGAASVLGSGAGVASGVRTMGLPLESSSSLPRIRGFCEKVVRGSSLGASSLAEVAAFARFSLRSVVICDERFLRSLSLLNALMRSATTSSSTRVLGLSSMLMFRLRRKSITVGRDTLRSFAILLILVFAILSF